MTETHAAHIEAPVEKVFDFFRNPMNWQTVSRGVVFSNVHVTPDGLGTYYGWKGRVAGVRLEGFDVYTEFVPNEHITDRSSSAIEGTWTYSFVPEGSGTKVTMEHHPRSVWGLPPLDRLVRLASGKGHDRVLDELKARLEGDRATAA